MLPRLEGDDGSMEYLDFFGRMDMDRTLSNTALGALMRCDAIYCAVTISCTTLYDLGMNLRNAIYKQAISMWVDVKMLLLARR